MIPLTFGKLPPKKKSKPDSQSSSAQAPSADESWLTKHQPRTSEDVKKAVSYQSYNKVETWLIRACNAHGRRNNSLEPFRPHVLALCGPSGCGKSTLVEVLCKEMDIDVITWTDDMWEQSSISKGGGAVGGGGFDSGAWKEERRSKVEEMETFVLQSKYPKLALTSCKHPLLTQSSTTTVSSLSHGATQTIKKTNEEYDLPTWRRIILIHDPPNLVGNHDPFAQQDSHLATQQHRLGELLMGFSDPVVLILSDVGGADDMNYTKKRCLPRGHEKHVDLTAIFQPGCTLINMGKTLKWICQREGIASSVPSALLEGVASSSAGDIRHAILQLELAVRSSRTGLSVVGLESALATSTLCSGVAGLGGEDEEEKANDKAKSKANVSAEDAAGTAPSRGKKKTTHLQSHSQLIVSGEDGEGYVIDAIAAQAGPVRVERRDARFSSLHSAGKLARAALNENGHLEFDCDQVVWKSELEMELLYPFVQRNVVDSLKETSRHEEMSTPSNLSRVMVQINAALGTFSDLEVLLSTKYDASAHLDRASNIFPADYASCILARASCVARGPGAQERIAASSLTKCFVPMHRPQVFDLSRNRARIQGAYADLREALTGLAGSSAYGPQSHSGRLHAPSEVNQDFEPMLQSQTGHRWCRYKSFDLETSRGFSGTEVRFESSLQRCLDTLRQLSSNRVDFGGSVDTMPAHPLEVEQNRIESMMDIATSNAKNDHSEGQIVVMSGVAEDNMSGEGLEDIDDPDS